MRISPGDGATFIETASHGLVSNRTDRSRISADRNVMRSSYARHLQLMVVCSCVILAWTVHAGQPVTDEMAGRWSGHGDIVVNWTSQRQILVQLTISPDGGVEGTIGDATLIGGRFAQNRGWLGRALDIKTDYIITGRLQNCVIAGEGVCRDSVKIPLDWSKGHFTGGLQTNGTIAGGKNRMVFTVARLSLLPARP